MASSTPLQAPASGDWIFCSLLRLFALPFLYYGLASAYTLSLVPAYHLARAQSWEPVPCQIASNTLITHPGPRHPRLHELYVVYTYTYRGESFIGARFRFIETPSRASSVRAERALPAYPLGSIATCYVNPRAPREVVIDRAFTTELFAGLIAVPFLAVGFAFLRPRQFLFRPFRH